MKYETECKPGEWETDTIFVLNNEGKLVELEVQDDAEND